LKIEDWLFFIKQNLINSSSNDLDAQLLLCHTTKMSKVKLFMNLDKEFSIDKQQLNSYITRINSYEPIAYILGYKDFYDIRVKVNKHVLVPRPETELMIDIIKDLNLGGVGIDVGTGSAAIAICLHKHTNLKISACDISLEALKVARKNINDLPISLSQSDLLGFYEDNKFDLVAANLPYIAENDEYLKKLVKEPIIALTAKNDGYALMFELIKQARYKLKTKGRIILEHGYNQHQKLSDFLQLQGFTNIKVFKDLNEHERVTLATLK
jgi:release factor glutamine methyltransferase